VIFVALSEAADRGELLLVNGGLMRCHRRRDGVVVVHEIIVLPGWRRRGVGRQMVNEIRHAYPNAVIRAVCPAEYEANEFWKALGFVIAEYKKPGKRQLVVWEFRPSATAPTATPTSPPPP
jgi:GNAT superfamily N-acetyltransferase